MFHNLPLLLSIQRLHPISLKNKKGEKTVLKPERAFKAFTRASHVVCGRWQDGFWSWIEGKEFLLKAITPLGLTPRYVSVELNYPMVTVKGFYH
jgi:hypothetical protein